MSLKTANEAPPAWIAQVSMRNLVEPLAAGVGCLERRLWPSSDELMGADRASRKAGKRHRGRDHVGRDLPRRRGTCAVADAPQPHPEPRPPRCAIGSEALEPLRHGNDNTGNVPVLAPHEPHERRLARGHRAGNALSELEQRPREVSDIVGAHRRSGERDVEEQIEVDLGCAAARVQQRIVLERGAGERPRRGMACMDASAPAHHHRLGVEQAAQAIAGRLHQEGHAFHQRSPRCSSSSDRARRSAVSTVVKSAEREGTAGRSSGHRPSNTSVTDALSARSCACDGQFGATARGMRAGAARSGTATIRVRGGIGDVGSGAVAAARNTAGSPSMEGAVSARGTAIVAPSAIPAT